MPPHEFGMPPAPQVNGRMESGLEARADAKLLRIVLHNLLGNAWKFTSKMASARISIGRAGEGFFVRAVSTAPCTR